MLLSEGNIGNRYSVQEILLPVVIERRLQALGMTKNALISILNSKGNGILVVKIRGTRFALGRNITKNIKVEEF